MVDRGTLEMIHSTPSFCKEESKSQDKGVVFQDHMVGWAQTPDPRLQTPVLTTARPGQLPFGPLHPHTVPGGSCNVLHNSRGLHSPPSPSRGSGGGLHPPPVVGGGSIPLPQFQGAPSPSHFLLFSVEAFPMESCLRGAACQGPELPFRMRQVTKSLVWEKLTEPFCEELVTIKIKYSPPAGLGSRERNHRVLVPIITETLA